MERRMLTEDLRWWEKGEDGCTPQSTDADDGQAHDVGDGGDPLDSHMETSLLWLLGKELRSP